VKQFNELFKSGDWKQEKHVPVIVCQEKAQAGEFIPVTITVGKELAHPNTTEHHIRWISIYFLADGEAIPYQAGHFDFTAHGESAQGPNTGPVYTHHEVTCSLKLSKPGTLFASSLCNIHGLWQSARAIAVS
jgi:superoxide reductase